MIHPVAPLPAPSIDQQPESGLLLTLSHLQHGYTTGQLPPSQLVRKITADLENRGDDGIWITTSSTEELLARASELEAMDDEQRQSCPLWGIPFSVKDCIDISGWPTSAACPEFAYHATQTNPVIQMLLDAGAILIGKTNLDQFATGLVGIRTGYTTPHNAFSKDYIPGGSSSGAALSVAAGLVSFAIGTDTGGSGRVPAAMNNIVGLKPTKGLLSTRHTVEACKTLDCLSIFALTAADAYTVFELTQGCDPDHPFSRDLSLRPNPLPTYQSSQPFRFGVPQPEQREFFGNTDVKDQYEEAIATLIQLGGTCFEIDYASFLQANELLFNGAWVAERYASIGRFIDDNPGAAFPITRQIISQAKTLTAVEAFEGLYAVEQLKRTVYPLWDKIDCLVVPTTGTVYRIDEIEAEPVKLNANLGYYTNFVNLLDLAAIALPNGFQSNGIPTGVTFIAPPFSEAYLTGLGSAFHHASTLQLGATSFTLAAASQSTSP
ncbi:MAG: allophanate hydrolase [Cyanobacteria bacterium J06659_2]